MSAISQKSISGITSITTPAGVDNVFTVHTNDTTERFRVDSTGNLNIAGIVTVTKDLDVDGHTNLDNVSIAGVTTSAGIVQAAQFKLLDNAKALYGDSGDLQIYHSTNSLIQNGTGSLQIVTTTGDLFLRGQDNITFNTAGNNERLRITSTGEVGINSTSPQTRLDVIESYVNRTWTPSTSLVSLFERSGICKIGLVAAADSYCQIDFGDPNDDNVGFIRYQHTDNSMSFRTNTDEQLRITSDGKVGIGTNDPKNDFHILGTSPGILITDSNAAADNKNWSITAAVSQLLRIQAQNDSNSGGGNIFDFYRSGNQVNEFRGLNSGNTWFVVDNNNKRVGINTNIAGTTLDVFGILQVKNTTGNQNLHVSDTAFKYSQSSSSWTNMTYTSSPILAWDYKSGPGDLFYIGSGGNTAMSSQMALVVSDGHGIKFGKSGYDGTDFDVDSNNEFLRIATDGKVGINISTPGTMLHQHETSSAANYHKFTNGSTGATGTDGAYVGLDASERFIVWTQEPGRIRFGVGNAERAYVNNDGHLGIVDGNLIVENGHGIDFSATGDSAGNQGSSELFDDYEEGTWTPAFKAGNNSTACPTNVSEATYTKVGRLVTATAYFTLSSYAAGGTGGDTRIVGLPYVNIGQHGGVSINYWWSLKQNINFMTGTVQGNTSQILIRGTTSAAVNTSNLDFDNTFESGDSLILTATYFAS